MRANPIRNALFAVALALPTLACRAPDSARENDLIYTTSPVFASIVRGVAGDSFRVYSLLPPGQSPHTFEPRPSDVLAATRARMLVYGAPNLDEWVARMPDVPRLSLISLIPDSLRIPPDSQEPNPHFWVDPLAVKSIVAPLTEALCELDADRCGTIRENAVEMHARLDSLDAVLRARLAVVRHTGYVVSHPFLDYFSVRYDLRTVNIVEGSGNLEPSARDLSRLIRRVTDEGFVAVVTERSEPSAAARTVARGAGLTLVSVDPLGGGAGPVSYDDVLSTLAANLIEAAK